MDTDQSSFWPTKRIDEREGHLNRLDDGEGSVTNLRQEVRVSEDSYLSLYDRRGDTEMDTGSLITRYMLGQCLSFCHQTKSTRSSLFE